MSIFLRPYINRGLKWSVTLYDRGDKSLLSPTVLRLMTKVSNILNAQNL